MVEDLWVKLLCEDRDVDPFMVRLAVQVYWDCISGVRVQHGAPNGYQWDLAKELEPIMKPAKHEKYLDLTVLVQDLQKKAEGLFPTRKPNDILSRNKLYNYDWEMDIQIALILSQCKKYDPMMALLNIEAERQGADLYETSESSKLKMYLKVLQEARRVIKQERLVASDLNGYDEDNQMAVVLEKLIGPDKAAAQPNLKDAIEQARRIIMMEIAVKEGKHAALRYYVDLGGHIYERGLGGMLRKAALKGTQMVSILLQHQAVSEDTLLNLFRHIVNTEPPSSESMVKLILKNLHACQLAIDTAYSYVLKHKYNVRPDQISMHNRIISLVSEARKTERERKQNGEGSGNGSNSKTRTAEAMERLQKTNLPTVPVESVDGLSHRVVTSSK